MDSQFAQPDWFVSTSALLTMLVMLALFALPARVVQKRHGYPAWTLVFTLVPYFGPYILLWAFATSEPRKIEEVLS
ncbi:hypothetical protein [Pseudosulfitobacter koreensis]|uniref:Phospholipase_D-nuclease N-terminal n=1 Tax=Pseudosulfitobacter koreensis TaxID=2968472 RepID=A0ABT1YZY8_9RHOB|nr:hypothetical protein [Pseudosulfitobacter koreense]MCR8826458.1 hypothetical protein [Pseudosulfitobacter koreense]